MFKLIKSYVDKGEKKKVVIETKAGSYLFFNEGKFVKKYTSLELCLRENGMTEFLKK